MVTFNKPITVVCSINKQGDINPCKFRLKEAGVEARTCFITSVDHVKYSMHFDEESISYDCLIDIDGEEVACCIKFIIDSGTWILHQMHSNIGIAMA